MGRTPIRGFCEHSAITLFSGRNMSSVIEATMHTKIWKKWEISGTVVRFSNAVLLWQNYRRGGLSPTPYQPVLNPLPNFLQPLGTESFKNAFENPYFMGRGRIQFQDCSFRDGAHWAQKCTRWVVKQSRWAWFCPWFLNLRSWLPGTDHISGVQNWPKNGFDFGPAGQMGEESPKNGKIAMAIFPVFGRFLRIAV